MTSERIDIGQAQDLHLMKVLRLLSQLVLVGQKASPGRSDRAGTVAQLESDMTAFCQALGLRRSVIFEAVYDDYFDGLRLLPLAAHCTGENHDGDGSGDGAAASKAGLSIASKSEVFALLHEGQWIPLGKSTGSASANIPHAMRELADFLDLQPTRSAVVFPLTAGSAAGAMSKPLCGLVLMERDAQTEGFSENLLDLGAIVSQLLEPRLLQLAPASAAAPPQKINSARRVDEDSLSDLSRRLNYERWLRLTICKLHSSLDRDHVLQTLADSLGRAFRTTRCLIIRTDGPSHPMVTHEYVEPDLSPLGLGRTGQFPMFAISLFTQKTISYGDVSQIRNTGPLIPPEVEQLLENGILSMAGAPLSYQGQPFGVLILVDGSRARQWTEEEMETIELTASQASVALSHSQTYHQVKDQLFHMNLLGNLTQQLTNALEVATKSPTKNAAPSLQDKNGGDGIVTPLSSREMEVLRLIASGLANREIAQRLFLTESTVELHASRIRKKLHLKSRTALVKYACDNSLV